MDMTCCTFKGERLRAVALRRRLFAVMVVIFPLLLLFAPGIGLAETTPESWRGEMYPVLAEAADNHAQRALEVAAHAGEEHEQAEAQQHAWQQLWLWTLAVSSLVLMLGALVILSRLRRVNRRLQALNAELVQSGSQLQATLDALPDQLFEMGLDGRYLTLHSPPGDRLAVEAQALLGKTIEEMLPPIPAAICMSALREADEKGYSFGRQFWLQLLGEQHWFEVSVARKKTAPGEAPRFIALSRDISERKRAEALLAEREFASRSLAENIPDNVARWDVTGRYLFVNPAYERTLEKSASELIGTKLPESQHNVCAVVGQVVADRQAIHATRKSVVVNGLEELHDVSFVPEFDESGALVSVLGIGRNMTDHYRMQEAIVAREREFRTLAETLPDNIALYDLQCRIVYQNPSLELMFGQPTHEVAGKTPMQVNPGIAAVADYQRKLEQVISSGEALEFETSLALPDGAVLYHNLRFVPERNLDGEMVGVLAIGRDITDKRRMEDDLRIRGQYQRALLDNFPFMVWLKDTESRLLAANRAYLRAAGIADDADILGKTDLDLFPHQDAVHYWEDDREVMQSGCKKIIVELIGQPGQQLWHETYKAPVLDNNGNLLGTVGFARDITDSLELQRKLQLSENNYRTLVEGLPDGIVRLDTAGRLLYLNDAALRNLGLPEPTLQGNKLCELELPGNPGYMRPLLDAVLRVAASAEAEQVEFSWHNGNIAEVRLVPEMADNGEVISVLAILRDITVHKRAEEDLRKREREFRTLAENIPDNIIRYDMQARKIYLNLSTEILMGGNTGNLTGLTPEQTLPALNKQDVAEFAAKVRKVLQTGEPQEIELEVRHVEHGRQIHNVRFVAERDEQGEIIGALAMGRDISQLKRIESELKESRAQLRGLTAQREQAREEERKRIAREVHDELGQILTGLKLNISVLHHKLAADSPQLRRHLNEALMLTGRSMDVVRDVASALRPAALDMGIASSLEWLAERFSTNTGIHCEVSVAEEQVQLEEDCAIALFRIVQESLTNVTRHAQASRVQVSLARQEDDYVLKVHDNGVGFAANNSKPGSFGLVGIRERALLLGGTVDINSQPGAGTEITVRVPAQTI